MFLNRTKILNILRILRHIFFIKLEHYKSAPFILCVCMYNYLYILALIFRFSEINKIKITHTLDI